MDQNPEMPAWIEGEEIGRVSIESSCAMGRSPSNQVVLNDEKISRRHAAIHRQGQNEYWIADLGSRNGVVLNGRRIGQPTRLRDQDQIQLGPFRFSFRIADGSLHSSLDATSIEKTVSDIRPVDCWMLVVDIESSTDLSQRLTPEELPVVTGRWLEQCKDAVETEGGAIDKYLGDGFMAYWREEKDVGLAVARSLRRLSEVRASGPIPFRIVVHFGRVFSGGAAASGVERFFGPEVNYLFKMERLASNLKASCLLSRFAFEKMADRTGFVPLGEHPVAGFEGRFPFYSL